MIELLLCVGIACYLLSIIRDLQLKIQCLHDEIEENVDLINDLKNATNENISHVNKRISAIVSKIK
jgi:hypothetical protein